MPLLPDLVATVKPQLIKEYVKTGKVRLEYHHFPLAQHEPGATMSALAAECAADQGFFWPYQDKLFQMAALDQQAAVQFDDLVGYAMTWGWTRQVHRLPEQPGASGHDHRLGDPGYRDELSLRRRSWSTARCSRTPAIRR